MTPLTSLPATTLSARIAAGELSSVEVVTAFLDRIEAVNPALNALVSLRPREAVLAEAEAADRGPRRGWLHGLPMAPKDLVATAGLRTTWGSPLYRDHVPASDDLLAARLRAAGAIFVGKTNTPEFGLGSHSFNEVFGATLNPWDRSRSAGGSSGGAAVALAARMLPVADGSDMMGSLRNPAAWNAVYGFRPTWGLVPSDSPGDRFIATLSTEGPMARNIRDLAHLLEVIAGPDPAVPFGRLSEAYARLIDSPTGPLRIGWLADWGRAYLFEDGILDLCEAALGRMQDELGATIVRLDAPMPASALWSSWMTLRAFLNAGARRALHDDPARRAMLKPELVWEIEQGLGLDPQALYAASVARTRWHARLARLFAEEVDLIALPAAQVWPFPVEWRWPRRIGDRAMDTYHRWMEVVVPASLGGLPTLSVPVGFGGPGGGLPMGMQIAGPVGADALVLRFGHAWNGIEGFSAVEPVA